MSKPTSREVARIVVPGLVVGGLIGAGVGLGFYPPVIGVGGAVVLAIAIGMAVRRLRGRS